MHAPGLSLISDSVIFLRRKWRRICILNLLIVRCDKRFLFSLKMLNEVEYRDYFKTFSFKVRLKRNSHPVRNSTVMLS